MKRNQSQKKKKQIKQTLPIWDSSISNLTQYKLSDTELIQKKAERTSKNRLIAQREWRDKHEKQKRSKSKKRPLKEGKSDAIQIPKVSKRIRVDAKELGNRLGSTNATNIRSQKQKQGKGISDENQLLREIDKNLEETTAFLASLKKGHPLEHLTPELQLKNAEQPKQQVKRAATKKKSTRHMLDESSEGSLEKEGADCMDVINRVDSLNNEIKELLSKYSNINTTKSTYRIESSEQDPPRTKDGDYKIDYDKLLNLGVVEDDNYYIEDDNPFSNPTLQQLRRIDQFESKDRSSFENHELNAMLEEQNNDDYDFTRKTQPLHEQEHRFQTVKEEDEEQDDESFNNEILEKIYGKTNQISFEEDSLNPNIKHIDLPSDHSMARSQVSNDIPKQTAQFDYFDEVLANSQEEITAKQRLPVFQQDEEEIFERSLDISAIQQRTIQASLRPVPLFEESQANKISELEDDEESYYDQMKKMISMTRSGLESIDFNRKVSTSINTQPEYIDFTQSKEIRSNFQDRTPNTALPTMKQDNYIDLSIGGPRRMQIGMTQQPSKMQVKNNVTPIMVDHDEEEDLEKAREFPSFLNKVEAQGNYMPRVSGYNQSESSEEEDDDDFNLMRNLRTAIPN